MDNSIPKAPEANASKTLLVSDCGKVALPTRRLQRLRERSPRVSSDTSEDREKGRLAENPA